MVFSHPQILWLLVPALLVGICTFVFNRQPGQQRTVFIALTRMFCLFAAVLALSRPLLAHTVFHGRESCRTRLLCQHRR